MIFRSPFRKNQGGKYLNAYTITMMLKFPDVERFLSLISQHNFSGAVQRELKDSHLLGMVQPALDAELHCKIPHTARACAKVLKDEREGLAPCKRRAHLLAELARRRW